MAAILFLAGDKREMFPHTQLIIHDPSFFHNDIGGQKPHEIKQQLDKLNEVRHHKPYSHLVQYIQVHLELLMSVLQLLHMDYLNIQLM